VGIFPFDVFKEAAWGFMEEDGNLSCLFGEALACAQKEGNTCPAPIINEKTNSGEGFDI